MSSHRHAVAVVGVVLITTAAAAFACALPGSDEFASGAAADDARAPSSADGSSGGTVDGQATSSSGGTSSASSSSSSSSGTVDGAPSNIVNLLPDALSGFETTGACEAAGVYNAVTTTAAGGHSGSFACSICRGDSQTPNDIYTLDIDFLDKPPLNAEYHATAWVKFAAMGSPVQPLSIVLRSHNNNPFADIMDNEGNEIQLSDTWTMIETDLVISKRADAMDVYVLSVPAFSGPSCFLVDDVVVWRVK